MFLPKVEFDLVLLCNKVSVYCHKRCEVSPLNHEEVCNLAEELKAVNPFFLTLGKSGYLVADTFKEIESKILSQIVDGNYLEKINEDDRVRLTKIVLDDFPNLSFLYYEKLN